MLERVLSANKFKPRGAKGASVCDEGRPFGGENTIVVDDEFPLQVPAVIIGVHFIGKCPGRKEKIFLSRSAAGPAVRQRRR
jgi:hypothetical protein